MRALVLGATGATGKDLVAGLLADRTFTAVDIFVRRPVDLAHEKLNVHIVDFENPDRWQHLVNGDAVFSCLGTTLKVAGSKEEQWKVDYDYQYDFAEMAKANGVSRYLLVSAQSAKASSSLFYLKMKGLLEDAVCALGFPVTVIFRPGPLERDNTDRPAERISIRIIRFFNQIGMLKSRQPISTKMLAKAMISRAKTISSGLHLLNTEEIIAIGKK